MTAEDVVRRLADEIPRVVVWQRVLTGGSSIASRCSGHATIDETP